MGSLSTDRAIEISMHHRAFLTTKQILLLWRIDHDAVTECCLDGCGVGIDHQITTVSFFLSCVILGCLELISLSEKKFGYVSLVHHLGFLDSFHFTDI